MTPQRWQQIDQLFHAALEYEPNRRGAFLAQSCPGDEPLREQLEALIVSHEQADRFLETPASDVAAELLARAPGKLEVGQNIGHYNILASLGAGGMGEVYLAQDTQLERHIALKLLPAQFTIDAERVRRFEQEARAASALNHPNIVTIHEIGRSNSSHFIATEFIDGETLRERLTNNRLQLDEAVDIATQVASALSAAHAAGIVHRDIKPENIMLRRDGFIKVLDFGLAKLTPRQQATAETGASVNSMARTNPGMVMGTVQYMSPEQTRGQDVDARTDIWSLGVVLYEMVTGHVPFSGETPSHVVVSILENQLHPLGHEGEAPPELEEIVDKALRKSREERYETVNDLSRDLRSLKQELEVNARLKLLPRLDGDTGVTATVSHGRTLENAFQSVATSVKVTAAHPTSSAEYLVAQIKRHKRSAALAAAAMFLVVATLAYFFYLKRGGEHLAASGEEISLAVLPFKPLHAASRNEALELGMADTLINKLSGLSKLIVRPMSSVRRYAAIEQDPVAAGRELGVDYVLEGNLQMDGEKIRATMRLLSVKDGAAVWADKCDEQCRTIFELQDAIAERIASALALRLTTDEKEQLEKRYTQNTEAYQLYNMGRYYSREGKKEGLEKSIEYYEQAIKIDPKYAMAYVGLSESYLNLVWFGFIRPKEGWRGREWAALKAVELDDTLSEAHVALAGAKRYMDWAGAEKEYKRALELNPNSLMANQQYATYLAYSSGRADEAIFYAKRADEIGLRESGCLKPPDCFRPYLPVVYFIARQYDAAIEGYHFFLEKAPNNPNLHFILGEAYVAKGMYKESIAELRKAVELDNVPERWDRHPMLAYAYGVSGQHDEALKILAEQKRLAKRRYISAYNFAIIYTGLSDKDRAFEYLRKALDDGMPLIHLQGRPMFDSLRSDPRYTELLRRLNRTP